MTCRLVILDLSFLLWAVVGILIYLHILYFLATIINQNINETKSEKKYISSLHVNNDIELLAISGVVLP